tara:strand:+ start:84 stop:446 length:363 start_codon:yes stop_codon:yes gene_type:complete
MSDDKNRQVSFSLDEDHAIVLMEHADQQIEIIADLLTDKGAEDILDLKVMTLLCDAFSSNFHIWRILRTNLNHNTVFDSEKNTNVVAISEQDLFMTENAILSKAFSNAELLKLNYSLDLH